MQRNQLTEWVKYDSAEACKLLSDTRDAYIKQSANTRDGVVPRIELEKDRNKQAGKTP